MIDLPPDGGCLRHGGLSAYEGSRTHGLRAMTDTVKRYTGGCLCGAVRYEAEGEPNFAGYCFCEDCRKASGSGFIPFMGFPARALRISGETKLSRTRAARGGQAVRNHCAVCGSLVFGGIVGQDSSHTVYAGSLDDPALFQPTMAIFGASRPHWVPLPDGLTVFERMPQG